MILHRVCDLGLGAYAAPGEIRFFSFGHRRSATDFGLFLVFSDTAVIWHVAQRVISRCVTPHERRQNVRPNKRGPVALFRTHGRAPDKSPLFAPAVLATVTRWRHARLLLRFLFYIYLSSHQLTFDTFLCDLHIQAHIRTHRVGPWFTRSVQPGWALPKRERGRTRCLKGAH